MGEAKRNPTAIAAKKGTLPPKPRKLGKRETERLLIAKVVDEMSRRTGLPPEILLGNSYSKIV